jgi:uncharacterized SAM-binding protein YcdF (DUF218 family)
MFFFFSKILEFFIYPLSWVLMLLAAALIIKNSKLKRRVLYCAIIVLIVFSNPILLNTFANCWDVKPTPLKTASPYSCAIVLGGFSSEGANGNGYFNGAADRFIQGLKLLTTGKVSHILISSGNGSLLPDSFREADWVKTQLEQFKVPDSCILIEDQSRNTIENAAFSKRILNASHLQPPYVLVTSAFHMRRSLGIFKKDSINVVPYPCNYMAGGGGLSPGNFVPDAQIFSTWNIYIKEVIGTLVNYFR